MAAPSPDDRPRVRRPADRPFGTLEMVCVLVVLLALALLATWVVLHWSEGRANVLG